MADWPLHITLADVFAIDLKGIDVESKLQEFLSTQKPVKTLANEETALGNVKVVLLDNNTDMAALHAGLVDLLEQNGAIFNTPEFTREGFTPHCTIQKNGRLYSGDWVEIDAVSLIDMFPNGNWKKEK